MNDPLNELKDIHLPTAIGWWPIAYGWYVVAFFIGLFLVSIGYLLCHYIKRRHRYQLLMNEFMQIKNQYQKIPTSANIISQLAIFLRRMIVTYYPQHYATLYGEKWLTKLAEITNDPAYKGEIGKLLITASYQEKASTQTADLIKLIENTIKKISRYPWKQSKC